jgi:clan AA aspartic protease (TIGR02281 family)
MFHLLKAGLFGFALLVTTVGFCKEELPLAIFLKKSDYKEIILQKNQVGHFQLKAKINGIEGLFTLDTGASKTVLDKERSKKFKITAASKDTQAGGLGTSIQKAKITSVDSLEVGSLKFEKLPVAVVDLSSVNDSLSKHGVQPQDGVIGADVLETSNAIIDYKNHRLYLKKSMVR